MQDGSESSSGSPLSIHAFQRLTVNVSPRARCSIKVVYGTTVSSARGLGKKTGGRITWRWKVGSNTNPGSWPETVDCGQSGKLTVKATLSERQMSQEEIDALPVLLFGFGRPSQPEPEVDQPGETTESEKEEKS